MPSRFVVVVVLVVVAAQGSITRLSCVAVWEWWGIKATGKEMRQLRARVRLRHWESRAHILTNPSAAARVREQEKEIRRHNTFLSSRALATPAPSENSHAKAREEKQQRQQRYLQTHYTYTPIGRETHVPKNGEREG